MKYSRYLILTLGVALLTYSLFLIIFISIIYKGGKSITGDCMITEQDIVRHQKDCKLVPSIRLVHGEYSKLVEILDYCWKFSQESLQNFLNTEFPIGSFKECYYYEHSQGNIRLKKEDLTIVKGSIYGLLSTLGLFLVSQIIYAFII